MPINLYPVLKTEMTCEDYTVRINGKPVPLDTARVSAVPLNRRWPGHQRAEDQTELINFLSLAADEPVTFEIIPQSPFETAEIRPLSLGIQPKIKDGAICFTLEKPAYFTVEPYGRNHALHIFVDPVESYPVDPEDKNVIFFGPGEHDVGQICLESNQTLYIDAGAVVYACVRAVDAENIKILGRGILDNSKNKETILFACSAQGNETAVNNARRQHTIQLEYCTNVDIEGITIRDSLVYNIRPQGCTGVHISNVKIIGCWRYNSDGIDMHNCVDVLIENCFLRTFDDCICVKGFDHYTADDAEAAARKAMYRNGKAYDVFRSAVIRNCVLWNDWGKCLEIGAETRAEEICNITFEDCKIIHVTGPVLSCHNVDYAEVYDVVYRNIQVEYDDVVPAGVLQKTDSQVYAVEDPEYVPTLISVKSEYHFEYSAGGTRRGINRNICFQNIHLLGRQVPKLEFYGYDEAHKTKNIRIENLSWNGQLLEELPEASFILGKYTENIRYRANKYSQLEKNTVSAARQLTGEGPVRFINGAGGGKRILFAGNSITLHDISEAIGWHLQCGMAASREENDYVHRLIAEVSKTDPDAAYCICQVSQWEWQYENGEQLYPLYEKARDFGADIIVMRFVENCPRGLNPTAFKEETAKLLDYLNPTGRAAVILTTGFLRHPGDAAIETLAKERKLPLIHLGDLGEQDAMKAVGLFEHTGVANHPGDLGMQEIACRIFPVLEKYL